MGQVFVVCPFLWGGGGTLGLPLSAFGHAEVVGPKTVARPPSVGQAYPLRPPNRRTAIAEPTTQAREWPLPRHVCGH